MKLFRNVLISLLFVFIVQKSQAQSFPLNLLGPSAEVTIPFEYHQGFIVVDIIFQKMVPLRFILDTGAENTILLKKEYAVMMNMTYQKKIQLLGSDMSKPIFAYICNGSFLQLANTQTVRHNIIVLEEEHLFLEEYLGTKVDGILGAEFIKGHILRIDYKRYNIVLSDPKKYDFDRLNKYHKYDIEIINSKPYLNCVTEVISGHPTNTKLLLDTGAGLSAMFHNNTDTLLDLPAQIVKGSLGKGLGGEIEGFSGKIHQLTIGKLKFTNMISSFQDLDELYIKPDKVVRNGLLGNVLFERFDIVFDLANSKLYLDPKKNYNKDFEFDKSGMTIFAFGKNLDQYYVKYVLKDSPAFESGIFSGDIITKVGCWSRRWFTLRQLNKKFIGKTGKKVKITIKRNNVDLKKTIVLRDLFIAAPLKSDILNPQIEEN